MMSSGRPGTDMEASKNGLEGTAGKAGCSPDRGDIENMSREDLIAEVTLLRAVVDRLNRIGTIKTGLSRAIYHDLKSPINTVISLIDIVLEESFGEINEKQKDFLRRAENALYRQVSLVEKCLDIERIEGELFREKPDDLLVEEILKPVMKNLQVRAQKKNLDLSLEIEKGLPSITANERGLRHVFQNLVGNAIKYTPDNGSIKVSASKAGEELLFSVADSGVGIAEKDIENIFKPFYRCKGAAEMDKTGTGLGLAITKMVLDTCGGRVEVESEPGKGTTFKVYYPFQCA